MLAVCVALSLLAPAAISAEPTITYKHESEAEFAQQLAAKKIQSAVVNKRLRTVRLTLKDGTHVLAKYPAHQEPATVAKLKAQGVTVSVLAKPEAEKEAKTKKPAHHKIRYIVGAVVIAAIVIVGVVLLVNRRRQRD
jgi:ribosomal protein S11